MLWIVPRLKFWYVGRDEEIFLRHHGKRQGQAARRPSARSASEQLQGRTTGQLASSVSPFSSRRMFGSGTGCVFSLRTDGEVYADERPIPATAVCGVSPATARCVYRLASEKRDLNLGENRDGYGGGRIAPMPHVRSALLSVAHALPPHRLLQTEAAEAARGIFAHRYAAFERMVPVFTTSGIESAIYGEAARLVFYFPGLAGAQRGLSGGRAGSLRRGGNARDRGSGLRSSFRDRHDRHHLLDRHRDAQPRSARCRTHGLSRRRRTRAGVRSGLRRRGLRPGASPAVSPPRVPVRTGAAGRHRDLYRGLSAWTSSRPPTWWRPPCSVTAPRPVSFAPAQGGEGLARIEGAGEHRWPDTLDIMGWKVDPAGLGVIFDRSIPPFAETGGRTGGREHPVAHRRAACIGRLLCLPSRWCQGDHGIGRRRSSLDAGHARPRT